MITGVSIIVSSIPAIAGAGITAYYDVELKQLFIISLDALIVTVLMLIFMICEVQKPSNFFADNNVDA